MRPIAITGVGCVTPLGVTQQFWENLLAARNAFSSCSLSPRHFRPRAAIFAAKMEAFRPATLLGEKGLRTVSYDSQLFASAAVLACQKANLEPKSWNRSEVGVLVATATAGLNDYTDLVLDALTYGIDRIEPAQGPQTGFNGPAAQFSIRYGAEGPNVTMLAGASSTLEMLDYGAFLVHEKRANVIVAGSVDVLPSLAGLASKRSMSESPSGTARPFDRHRDGYIIGESAAAFVLETSANAGSRNAGVIAEIAGSGTAFRAEVSEANLPNAAERAIAECLRDSSLDASDIDVVFASAAGDRVSDAAEARALATIFGDQVPVCAIKGAIGECLSASAGLQVAAAVLSLQTGRIPPTAGFQERDPALPQLCITTKPLHRRLRNALVHGMDGGRSSALLIRAAQ